MANICVVLVLLTILCCIALAMNILHSRNETKSLVENIEQAQADFQVANAAKTALQSEKDTIAKELEAANGAKTALHAEIDKLAADLVAAKTATGKPEEQGAKK